MQPRERRPAPHPGPSGRPVWTEEREPSPWASADRTSGRRGVVPLGQGQASGARKCKQGPAGEGGWPGPARRVRTSPPRQGPASEGAQDRTRPSNDASRAVVTGVTERKRESQVMLDQRQPQGRRSGRRDGRGGRRDRRDPLVRRPQRRARVGLALVGPEGHRPLGLGGDRQRRVHAEVGGDRGAVGDVEAGVAVHPLVGVDHARLGRVAPIAQPPMKCAVSGRLNGSPIGAAGGAAHHRRPSGGRPRCRPGSRSGSGSPWPCRDVSTPATERGCACRNVVIELSRLCMTRAMTVRSDQCRTSYRSRTRRFSRHISRSQVRHRGRVAVPVGEHGLQQRHRVAALAVADRLDVGVLVGVEGRGDRDALACSRPRRPARSRRGSTRSWCGTSSPSRSERLRQVALGLHPVQQPLGAEGRGGEHDLVGGEHAGAPCAGARLALRVAHVHVVPAARRAGRRG